MSRPAFVLLTAFLARFAMAFHYSSIAAMGPMLVAELDITYGQLGWLVACFTAPAIILAIPGGYISQRYGDLGPGMASIGLLALGATLCAISGDFSVLLAGRLISGTGATVVTIITGTLLSRWFMGHRLANALSVSFVSWPLGIGASLFFIPAIAETAGAVYAFLFLATFCGIPLIMLAAIRKQAWQAPYTRTGSETGPVTGLGRLEIMMITAGAFLWFALNGGYITLISFGPVHIADGSLSATQAGFLISIATIGNMIAILFSGRINEKLGNPFVLTSASIMSLAASIGLFTYFGALPAVLFFAGIASGLPVPVVMAMIVESVPDERRNLAMGLFYALFYALLAVLLPVAGGIGDYFGTTNAPLLFGALISLSSFGALLVFRHLRGNFTYG